LDIDSFSTRGNATKEQPQRKEEADFLSKHDDISDQPTRVVESGQYKGIHLATHP
jgi:hypothetical protein